MIGRTLFWYIFRDLMKIFLMANGALAGIMSFGGLLRPLTHQGLDVGQVTKLLSYFSPAMTTYSLPIAALFATTVVYGRLSADNELTACRAGGLSHLSVALPAFVMGICVAIMSLVFLCFIVPRYTLKVEQTLYSNMAKLIVGQIQGSHKIRFGQVTIFAQSAYIPPENGNSGQQMVVLKGPTIETAERPIKNARDYRVPRDFYTASRAVLYIEQRGKGEQRGTGKVYLTIHLEEGVKFPREFQGAMTAGVRTTDYGPLEVDSPIREQTKFMNVWRLKRLYDHPSQAAKIKRALDEVVQRDQQSAYALEVGRELDTKRSFVFEFENDESYVLSREPGAPPSQLRGQELVLPAPPPIDLMSGWALAQTSADGMGLIAGTPPIPGLPMRLESSYRPLRFEKRVRGQPTFSYSAREARLSVNPSGEPGTLRASLDLIDAASQTADGQIVRQSFVQPFTASVSAPIRQIGGRGVDYYTSRVADRLDRQHIGRELLQLSNEILAESNSRVSFAISCLVLVMVGCALGMMFRSGNYLSAFAVSFIPAMLTITLIVAGQRVSGNVPEELKPDIVRYLNSPLRLGMALIWTGNCANFVLATALLGRLQKT